MRYDDADPRSFSGYMPLAWAGCIGLCKVIEKPLRQGDFNPDEPDNCGRIPLLYAANHGHKKALKALGGREEVDPDKPDSCDQILLSYVAIPEHEEKGQIACTIRVGICQF